MIDTASTNDDPPHEHFRKLVLNDHPSLGWKLPGIHIHNKSEVLEDFPELPYRKLSELWFDDDNARMALLATPGKSNCRRRCYPQHNQSAFTN